MKSVGRNLIVISFMIASPQIVAQTTDQADPAALSSAEAFLQQLDGAEWQAAYDAGQFGIDFSLFEELVVKHRKDRGDPGGRDFVEVKPRLGGVSGAGSFRKTELVFETTFPDGPWTEAVTLVSDNEGPWLVEGYLIGPKQP